MLLKNVLSLSILARYSKNNTLRNTISNIISFSSLSRFINPIDIVLPILNIKLVDSAAFLPS